MKKSKIILASLAVSAVFAGLTDALANAPRVANRASRIRTTTGNDTATAPVTVIYHLFYDNNNAPSSTTAGFALNGSVVCSTSAFGVSGDAVACGAVGYNSASAGNVIAVTANPVYTSLEQICKLNPGYAWNNVANLCAKKITYTIFYTTDAGKTTSRGTKELYIGANTECSASNFGVSGSAVACGALNYSAASGDTTLNVYYDANVSSYKQICEKNTSYVWNTSSESCVSKKSLVVAANGSEALEEAKKTTVIQSAGIGAATAVGAALLGGEKDIGAIAARAAAGGAAGAAGSGATLLLGGSVKDAQTFGAVAGVAGGLKSQELVDTSKGVIDAVGGLLAPKK